MREQLVGLSFPNDAIGATSAVEERLVFDARDASYSADSRVTVDLGRSRATRRGGTTISGETPSRTERFPTVTFVPSEARRLPFPLPQSGSVSVRAREETSR